MNRWRGFELLCGVLSCRLLDGPPPSLRKVRWHWLINDSSRHLVSPTLAWCLQGREDVPEDFKAYFEAVLGLNQKRNQTIMSGLKRVVGALNACNIEPMLLKGAFSLVDGVYPDPSMRFLGDVDLLIEPGSVEKAALVLKELGFAPKLNDPVGPDHHHLPMLHDPSGLGVELHKSAIHAPFDAILSNAWLWSESRRILKDGMITRVPNPTQALVHNVIHDQLLHYNFDNGTFELRQLLDFALIARGRGVDWDDVNKRFRDANLGPVLATYAMFGASLLGMRLPALSSPTKPDALKKLKGRMQTGTIIRSLAREYIHMWARQPLAPIRLFRPRTWTSRARLVRDAFNSSVS